MAHKLEKISDDKDIRLLYATVMQELEDTIQRLNRSLVLLGIVYRYSEREGKNEVKETIKKKVLGDLYRIEAVCKEAKSEIETS
jgi:branched-subunit amino acid aminotransferase/4-amino-4-deoxychorismate lyase